ncbi:MAG: HEAT repeat domain-containing protein [Dehalococcoidia bacterium]|nr:HEAT repeat domain-containing protein [Dehalococcoidia bacterium]
MAEYKEVEKLIKQLSDEKWVQKRNAAEALGKLGDRSAVPYLKKARGDQGLCNR